MRLLSILIMLLFVCEVSGKIKNALKHDHIAYIKNTETLLIKRYAHKYDDEKESDPPNKPTDQTFVPANFVDKKIAHNQPKNSTSTVWYLDRDEDGWGGEEIAYYGNRITFEEIISIMLARQFHQTVSPRYFNPYASIDELRSAVTNSDDYDDSTEYITNIPPKWFYRDSDNDGYGNPYAKLYRSHQPNGYVTNSSDCKDNNSAIHPNTIWYIDSDGDGLGIASETITQCSAPTGYVLTAGDQCPELAGNDFGCPPLGQRAGLSDENYIYTITPQEPVASIGQLLAKEHLASITYYDGLGRPKQTIAVGVTPGGKDLVTPITYDAMGRQDKDYLPYPTADASGTYRPSAVEDVLAYYDTPEFDNTPNPYTQRIYEASPLNRVLEVGAPGADWQAEPNSDSDHTLKTTYDTNSNDDLVRLFTVDFTDGNTQKPVLVDEGVYMPGQLYKTLTRDENWTSNYHRGEHYQTATFTDKQGQVVLERSFSYGTWHDTYYVYDDYGNLTFVLPPEIKTYASVWQQHGSYWTTLEDEPLLYDRTQFVADYEYGSAYLSKYNKSIRLYYSARGSGNIHLNDGFYFDLNFGFSIPSGTLEGSVSYKDEEGVYQRQDIEGQLIGNRIFIDFPEVPMKDYFNFYLSKNVGNPRNDQPLLEDQLSDLAYEYRYDHRNRLVVQKIPGKGWTYTAYDSLDRPVLTQDANQRALNQALKNEYDAHNRVLRTGLIENISVADQDELADLMDADISTLLTEHFYDRYTFDTAGLQLPEQAVQVTQTQGLPTGAKVRVLGTNHYVTTLMGYDDKGRLIYSGTHNPYLELTETQNHTLNFVGQVTKTTTHHQKTGQPTLNLTDHYTYDHTGRLLTHIQDLNGEEEQLLTNTYDELGRLTQKNQGDRLQTLDYRYNIRGWLTHINEPYAATNNDNDLFDFQITYNDPVSGSRLYNGNISNTLWRTANDNTLRRYSYSYDGLNRLRSAYHYATGTHWGSYSENVNYDRNGNITYLNRKGAEGVGIDYLNFTYQGNQLLSVKDAYQHTEGLHDRNTTGDDYAYDANGNMTEDKNKGITQIAYNHLNLPTQIDVSNRTHSGSISYIYDAMGSKLQKTADQTTQYAGMGVYQNNELAMIPTPEGYIENSVDGFRYVYQHKDHLGNVRMSYSDRNNNGRIDTPQNTAETVFEEGFESASGWNGTGAMYGRPLTGFDDTFKRTGNYAGYIEVNTEGTWVDYYAHHDDWVTIDNAFPTAYRYSGWIYMEYPIRRAQFFMHMKDADETWYYTQFDYVTTYSKNQWVYMEKVVVVPPEIKKLNFRIDADSYNSGTVWYDDLKIERLDFSQSEIVSETNYYPFGLEHKGYNNQKNTNNIGEDWRFNGMEHQNDLGLNTYDFGARNYDPALGRWMNVDLLADITLQPYSAFNNNPINMIDPTGMFSWDWREEPWDWVQRADGTIYWDNNATSQATTKEGETYLDKNVLVGTHNRDASGNEAINTAKFDLYLESDKTGPSATIMGNTVPADIAKSGTLAEGLYSAKFGHRNREKYHNELAIRIYNLDGSDGLPTVNGNSSKANSDLLTGVLFHMGNNYQTSLFDSRGNAYSHGCQTSGCFPNSRPVHNAFMNKVGRDFKGTYYLRSKPILTVLTNQKDNK